MEQTKKTIVQKLKLIKNDSFLLAEKYYAILSAINDLKLTQREIQLIAFTAISGNMSYKYIREDFCKKYDTTSATINNIISKLKKMGVLVKNGSKIKVNPVILLNFSNDDVILEVKLFHGEA
jgi:DNA-binding MarR family transcriptional regulator